ncbi:MAG: type 1 glutamine amidotransferase [Rhizobiales bacterium]|nr:type 1 glutamine amidotransferase [Hyphomicrobiales bacterium]
MYDQKKIAIYLTDVWGEDELSKFDDYAQKFELMLSPHMPNTKFEHFNVMEGNFPSNPTDYDGVVITGSKAYVTDKSPWMEQLFHHIRILDAARIKIFAVCFGHQAVALALGGSVNHQPLMLGVTKFDIIKQKEWMQPKAESLKLHAGNFQQVTKLSSDMQLIAQNQQCLNAMVIKDNHILTLQFHPELSAKYMHHYIDDVEHKIDPELITNARKQVDMGADGDIFAKWAATFLSDLQPH